VTPKEELRELIGKACQAGLATVVHAIGDRAVRDVLDVFAETPRGNLRHRIEHVQVIHPDDLPRLAQLGIIASMQPIHCTSDMDVADRHWGKRAHWAYAFKSLLDAGTVLAFGSDCPVETLDPLVGVHAAVTRQRPLLPSPRQVETREGGRPIDGWYPEERLTVEQAVRAYTVGAAYASAEEAIKGTIAPGKLADLVVLSRDIFAIPPQEIVATQVDYTIFDGRVVYERK
jgi:predicted amidohydrolase YtcJ